ncbi:polyprenyl diphosphate synthase [Marinimicrobium sp. ARAG 43.8]|uniref:polyprenyl diphosphate synthase n=1 Tax=Marinimicrobium sp. ARAG 43.8 TaxID=3418719 RepID=UPI003CEC7E25
MSSNSLRHIAIIMDGNNRWAKQRGMNGVAGHKEGAERIRDIMTACQELETEVLTLFAFSSENWKRPRKEVEALMGLFQWYLKHETRELRRKNVRLKVIGNRDNFSPALRKAIDEAERVTQEGQTTLVIAADYGGRWDIAQAARRMAEKVAEGDLSPDDIDEHSLHDYTSLAEFPEPDLLIRTGGEVRISNFLLWQCAYAELYFSPVLWPAFGGDELKKAAQDFYQRQRRFGLTSDQVSGSVEARHA